MSIGNDLGQTASGLSNPITTGSTILGDVSGLLGNAPFSWLTSLGGAIASGFEGGIIAFLQDIWAIVEGPLLVMAGILVFLWVLLIYFRADIGKLGGNILALAQA